MAALNKNPNDSESATRLAELEAEYKQVQENIESLKEYANEKQKAQIETNNRSYESNQLDTEKQRKIMLEQLLDLYKQLGDTYERMAKLQDGDPKKDLFNTKVADIEKQINAIKELDNTLENDPRVQAASDTASARGAFANEAAMAKELEAQMKRLTHAINEYKKAQRGGDTGGMAHWKNEIDSVKSMTKEYQNHAKETGATQAIQDKIAATIEDQEVLTSGLTDEVKKNNSELSGVLNRYLSIAVVMRELRRLWKEAIDYVIKYYD